MRRNLTRFLKLLLLCSVTVLLTIFLYKTFSMVINLNDEKDNLSPSMGEAKYQMYHHQKYGAFFNGQTKNVLDKMIDWHDYSFILQEKNRTGLGEHGASARLSPADEDERRKIFNQNGFNGLLSDRISLNRSVADIRHKE